MRVVVCAKQIPDPATPYRLEPDSHWLVRPTDQVLDDTDRYGVEMGLQLASSTGGEVTIVSMGPAGLDAGLAPGARHGSEQGGGYR